MCSVQLAANDLKKSNQERQIRAGLAAAML
jgi:hypothetical protein